MWFSSTCATENGIHITHEQHITEEEKINGNLLSKLANFQKQT